jgi:hypothetical protein
MTIEVSASFQISSEQMSGAKLLQLSGLTAAVVHNKGESISSRQGSHAYAQSIVRIDSALSDESSVSEHLEYLVSVVEKCSVCIAQLPPECGREIWFKISYEQGQLGLDLPAHLLSILAPLDISIMFDIYCRT